MKARLLFYLAICLPHFISAQQIIQLKNPSFEGTPGLNQVPKEWFSGLDLEKKKQFKDADVLPLEEPENIIDVTFKAQDGETYLGLQVSDADIWNSIGQELSQPLKKGVTYTFSIHLARAEQYLYKSLSTGEQTNFTAPPVLRIYAGSDKDNLRKEKLVESKIITNHKWKEFTFSFTPRQDHRFILLESFYETPTLFAYNGNIILDNCSDIKEVMMTSNLEKKKELKKPVKEVEDSKMAIDPKLNVDDKQINKAEAKPNIEDNQTGLGTKLESAIKNCDLSSLKDQPKHIVDKIKIYKMLYNFENIAMNTSTLGLSFKHKDWQDWQKIFSAIKANKTIALLKKMELIQHKKDQNESLEEGEEKTVEEFHENLRVTLQNDKFKHKMNGLLLAEKEKLNTIFKLDLKDNSK